MQKKKERREERKRRRSEEQQEHQRIILNNNLFSFSGTYGCARHAASTGVKICVDVLISHFRRFHMERDESNTRVYRVEQMVLSMSVSA